MRRSRHAVAPSLVLSLASAALAFGIGGSMQLIPPPPTVEDGQLMNSLVLFQERDNTVLGADVALDMTAAGSSVAPTSPNTYPAGQLTPGVVPAGTLVDSWYVHFNTPGGGVDTLGSVTFDAPIIGLIVVRQTLDASDGELASPSTVYDPLRQIGAGDQVFLSADRLTVSVDFDNGGGTDQVRVVTEAAGYCPADCDGSGAVDFNDLVSMLFVFGPTATNYQCDTDFSGTVDFNDLVSALFLFGPCS